VNFKELLLAAKAGNETAAQELLMLYDPLLTKEAVVNRVFDEDLYQELRIVLLTCIRIFPV